MRGLLTRISFHLILFLSFSLAGLSTEEVMLMGEQFAITAGLTDHIDDFRIVNDACGYDSGDATLVAVASRLRASAERAARWRSPRRRVAATVSRALGAIARCRR